MSGELVEVYLICAVCDAHHRYRGTVTAEEKEGAWVSLDTEPCEHLRITERPAIGIPLLVGQHWIRKLDAITLLGELG